MREESAVQNHWDFALVLAGGLPHAGVLRTLEHYGYRPAAVVGATYGLNPDWYRALLGMDTAGFPEPPAPRSKTLSERLRSFKAYQHLAWSVLTAWGFAPGSGGGGDLDGWQPRGPDGPGRFPAGLPARARAVPA